MLDILTDIEVKAYKYLRNMYEPENIIIRHQKVPNFLAIDDNGEIKGYQAIPILMISKYRQEKYNSIRFYESDFKKLKLMKDAYILAFVTDMDDPFATFPAIELDEGEKTIAIDDMGKIYVLAFADQTILKIDQNYRIAEFNIEIIKGGQVKTRHRDGAEHSAEWWDDWFKRYWLKGIRTQCLGRLLYLLFIISDGSLIEQLDARVKEETKKGKSMPYQTVTQRLEVLKIDEIMEIMGVGKRTAIDYKDCLEMILFHIGHW